MPRASDHKAVVDTLVDEELDMRRLVEEAKGKGQEASDMVMTAVNRVLGAGHGHITKQALRQIWREVFLGGYVSLAGKAQEQTEQNLQQQIVAIENFGKPITEIAAVVDEDVKQRISEKEGV